MIQDSQIERFRVRYHGKTSKLRLLKRAPGTQKQYSLIYLCEAGFYVGRDYSTNETPIKEFLTLDLVKAGVNVSLIKDTLIAVDLIKPDTTFLRYAIASKAEVTSIGNRFVYTVNAMFNDNNPII